MMLKLRYATAIDNRIRNSLRTPSPNKASIWLLNKPVQTEENYRLTEENWTTIDPMIGLSEDDIAAFFNNN